MVYDEVCAVVWWVLPAWAYPPVVRYPCCSSFTAEALPLAVVAGGLASHVPFPVLGSLAGWAAGAGGYLAAVEAWAFRHEGCTWWGVAGCPVFRVPGRIVGAALQMREG